VVFSKSESEKFDVVILATGFRPDLSNLLSEVKGVLNEQGVPFVDGRSTAEPGLYFCGLLLKRTGQLREIGIDAKRIAGLARRFVQSRQTSLAAHGGSAGTLQGVQRSN
jgi:pyruvate/2-oxoglutarate dehydrogenase complex dihydrolipoamide dehydrogenase (E3) component